MMVDSTVQLKLDQSVDEGRWNTLIARQKDIDTGAAEKRLKIVQKMQKL